MQRWPRRLPESCAIGASPASAAIALPSRRPSSGSSASSVLVATGPTPGTDARIAARSESSGWAASAAAMCPSSAASSAFSQARCALSEVPDHGLGRAPQAVALGVDLLCQLAPAQHQGLQAGLRHARAAGGPRAAASAP